MKKELIAGISLVVILIGCIINFRYISSLTDELILIVEDTAKIASEEKWDNAVKKSENAIMLWEKNKLYLNIVLPNDTIDGVSDALSELQKETKAEDKDSTSVAAQVAITKLENASSMEKLSIKSIF